MKKNTNILNELKVKRNEPLSKYTFLKIGGPSDYLFKASKTDELIKIILEAKKLDLPITILGEGSNVLMSDKGIRGLTIINNTNKIDILDNISTKRKTPRMQARWEKDSKKGSFKYDFSDLDYDESGYERVGVRVDSGVSLAYLTDFLFKKGITGLQWYSGIPGTIGGAVFNNIHGGTHFIGEVIEKVRVINKSGKSVLLDIKDIGANYDKSRFHKSGEIITEVYFNLYKGDVGKAKYVRDEWAKRKSIQPRNSPGCAFQNLTQDQKIKLNTPTTSVGYVVEHLLKMTGFRIGDAAVSQNHNNFIVNEGKATAKEYLAVLKEIYWRAKEKLGIILVPEIFLMGFDKNEIKEFIHPDNISLRKQRAKEIRSIYKNSKKLFSK